jgi:hypothetical protein
MHKIHTLCTWSTNAELGHHSDKNSACQTFFNCNYPCCCNSTLLYVPYILMVTRISVTLITTIPYTRYKFTAHHMRRNKNKQQDITSMNLQVFPLPALTFLHRDLVLPMLQRLYYILCYFSALYNTLSMWMSGWLTVWSYGYLWFDLVIPGLSHHGYGWCDRVTHMLPW